VLPQLYILPILVAAAHYLGAEQFGRQSYIAFIEVSVVMLVSGGMPMSLTRFIGETLGRGRPDAVRALLRWAWVVEVAGCIIGGAVLIGAALLGAQPTMAWILAGVAASIGILHTVPSSLLIGTQRWRRASIVGLITGSIATAATIAVLAAGGGITGMFAVEVAASIANLAWTSQLAQQTLGELTPSPERDPALQAQTLRYALFATVGVVLTFIVWRRSEFFFLQRFSTYTQIALYSLSFSVINALVQVFEAVAGVVTPAVATLYGARAFERIRSGYGRALRLLVLGTLPITAASMTIAPRMLSLLGHQFKGTGPVIVIMLATFPVVPLVRTSTGLLHGLGRVRFILLAGVFAAVTNVTLDALVIPGNAAIGAAFANGGAQLVAAFPVLIYTVRAVGGVEVRASFIARAAVLAVGVGLAAWGGVAAAPGGAGAALGVFTAFATLFLLAPVLRVLPPEDAHWIESLAGAKLGGLVGRACRRCAFAMPEAETTRSA
jgi:O-antigen/teichoic acid export membrane protein